MSNKPNRMPGFHLYKGTVKPYYWWIFIAKNGKTISKSSEEYSSKQGAIKSIKAIIALLDAQDYCLYYDHTKARTQKDVPDLFVIK